MESARTTYDRFASIYDEWNSQNDYEMWLGEVLLPELEKHGLRKGWALDVGCGTGRAFEPLLGRGWQIVGCDISSRMLAEAGRKYGPRVQLLNLDARSLPPLCPKQGYLQKEAFQLVLILNDVVNYLTGDEDLEQVFLGVRRNLSRDQGLVVFDANTLALFRDNYSSEVDLEVDGRRWRGFAEEVKPGAVYEGEMSGRGVETHTHRQRHWMAQEIEEALEAAGLRCLAALGQREKDGRVVLEVPPSEERDAKVVYIAGHGGECLA